MLSGRSGFETLMIGVAVTVHIVGKVGIVVGDAGEHFRRRAIAWQVVRPSRKCVDEFCATGSHGAMPVQRRPDEMSGKPSPL